MLNYLLEVLDCAKLTLEVLIKMALQAIVTLGFGVVLMIGLLVAVKLLITVLRSAGVKTLFGHRLKKF